MSDDHNRSFKNEFQDFRGESFLDDHGTLNKASTDVLKAAIQSLLQVVEERASYDGKDYSVYTGSAGYALLYLHLHEKFEGTLKDSGNLKKATEWLMPCMKKLKGHRHTFLCGDAGPLAISAAIANIKGDLKSCREYISRLEAMCEEVCRDADLPDEVLYGRCGYLSALLFLQKKLGKDSINPTCVIKVVEAIIQSGEALAREERCRHPLMYTWHDKPYLGAAHGLAGIYFMLLQVKDPSVQEIIRQRVRPCIDFMLSLRFASGNCPSSIGSSSGDKLVHWCHGAPGWVHMFALAYKVYRDKRYLQAAKDCGEVVWKRGLLRKGYGLCHGSAGNAYTFLTLYKLTKEERYIYYAFKFAEWCCEYGKHGCRTPDRPFSLFEGMAGTIYFLTDMLDPAASAFPTFDFND